MLQRTKPNNIIKRELIRLLGVGATAFLALSLFSYSPRDPSWSTWSTRGEFRNWMGRVGSILSDLLFQTFGMASFAIGLLILVATLRKTRNENESEISWPATILWLISLSLLAQSFFPNIWIPWGFSNAGGVMGRASRDALFYGVGPIGTPMLASLFFVATTIVLFKWTLISRSTELFKTSVTKLRERLTERREAAAILPQIPKLVTPLPKTISIAPGKASEAPIVKRREEDEELFRMMAPASKSSSEKPKDVKVTKSKNGEFELPSLNLIQSASSKNKVVDRNWFLEKGNILIEKLKDFGVEGEIVNISPGPVITVYEFKPASGVKIKEIANLSDDLTLALSVLSVRIVAPIPGKPVVGIEIPSPHRETVHFRELVEETPFYTGDIRIPIVLGRLASGEPVVAGLASMPHLLVAGSTGTGKSVFINTLICSLLYRYTPKQLKLILVDPKMVELSGYEGIPHLLLPVVVDSKKAAMALRWGVEEMERRYSLLHGAQVRHIDAYNTKVPDEPLPYIVIVIDEYADLMAVVPKDVELSIARLAQKARASGIHLVCATQRPSTDVVTGTIKANFPSRLSFRVASSIDSKTILDRTGAERLLGQGDMLFHSAGFMSLKRLQGAFISDADIERVVAFLKQQGEPEYDEKLLQTQELAENGELPPPGGEADPGSLYDQAVRVVTDKGEASISLIQRHLKIGYNRAATLMEEMEKQGVVGPEQGAAKRRQVLVNAI